MSECSWLGQLDAPCTQATLWISSDGKREYCQYHADMFAPKGHADLRHLGDGMPYLEEDDSNYERTEVDTEG